MMSRLIPLIVLSCLLPLVASTRAITTIGDTLDHAESRICRQVAREGATTYRVAGAWMNDRMRITARIAD